MTPYSDELLHAPSDDALWQESCYFCWHDPKIGVAGAHRVGLQANGGCANQFCGIMTDEGTHFRSSSLTEAPSHGGAGADLMAAGPLSIRLGAIPIISYDTDELQMTLRAIDIHPPTLALQEGSGGYRETLLASNHYEGIARFVGDLKIGGHRYNVDGLGFRDHSWGPRDWNAMLGFRTCIGSTGPDLAWSAVVMYVRGKPLMTKGYVERNGKVSLARSVDLVCFIEADGLSHRGGICRMAFEDGTTLSIDAEMDKAIILAAPNCFSMEAFCKVHLDGKKADDAFCIMEMANNFSAGSKPPELSVRAALANGLSRRSDKLNENQRIRP